MVLHWYLYSKRKLQKEACKKREREREREIITNKFYWLKKGWKCAHTKQAMICLAWSTGPCQACPFLKSLTERLKAKSHFLGPVCHLIHRTSFSPVILFTGYIMSSYSHEESVILFTDLVQCSAILFTGAHAGVHSHKGCFDRPQP